MILLKLTLHYLNSLCSFLHIFHFIHPRMWYQGRVKYIRPSISSIFHIKLYFQRIYIQIYNYNLHQIYPVLYQNYLNTLYILFQNCKIYIPQGKGNNDNLFHNYHGTHIHIHNGEVFVSYCYHYYKQNINFKIQYKIRIQGHNCQQLYLLLYLFLNNFLGLEIYIMGVRTQGQYKLYRSFNLSKSHITKDIPCNPILLRLDTYPLYIHIKESSYSFHIHDHIQYNYQQFLNIFYTKAYIIQYLNGLLYIQYNQLIHIRTLSKLHDILYKIFILYYQYNFIKLLAHDFPLL